MTAATPDRRRGARRSTPAAGRRARRLRRRSAPPRGRRQDPAAPTPSTPSSSRAGRPSAGWRRTRSTCAALRRYVAGLSEAGQAPTTVARKLAALRGLFRHQIERRRAQREPRRAAQLAQALPAPAAGAEARRGGGAAGPDPARPPLELRDRALFELAYACGLRAEELVTLDVSSVDFDGETVRVEGKGGKTRLVPAGEHALAALERYLARAPAGARASTTARRCFSPSRGGGWGPRTSGGGCARGRGWPPGTRRRSPTLIRTRCAIPSPPICWRAAPTCGRSRSCSATPASRRLRFTLG